MNMRRVLPLAGAILAALFLSASCETYEPPAASIQGTVFTELSSAAALSLNMVPETVSGHVVLDDDKDFTNGSVKDYGITFKTNDLGSMRGFTFEFENVPAGSYYLYAIVDTAGDGTMSMTNSEQDAFAFYGDTNYDSWEIFVPASQNVVVGTEGYIDCDFWLGIPANHG